MCFLLSLVVHTPAYNRGSNNSRMCFFKASAIPIISLLLVCTFLYPVPLRSVCILICNTCRCSRMERQRGERRRGFSTCHIRSRRCPTKLATERWGVVNTALQSQPQPNGFLPTISALRTLCRESRFALIFTTGTFRPGRRLGSTGKHLNVPRCPVSR